MSRLSLHSEATESVRADAVPPTAGYGGAMPNLALELGKLTASAGVTSVYGEQQDVDGVRVIPVAATWSGFGAGEEEGKGAGGGGGGVSLPVGAYIRRGDDIRFEANLISLLVVGVPFVWVAGRSLARIIRALKR